jgi:hypothetical protein
MLIIKFKYIEYTKIMQSLKYRILNTSLNRISFQKFKTYAFVTYLFNIVLHFIY